MRVGLEVPLKESNYHYTFSLGEDRTSEFRLKNFRLVCMLIVLLSLAVRERLVVRIWRSSSLPEARRRREPQPVPKGYALPMPHREK